MIASWAPIGLVVFALGAGPDSPAGLITPAQIEADWLRQDEVRGVLDPAAPMTAEIDAAGACDGVKDGSYGFHTAREDRPWWQVDLCREVALDQVFVFNRSDAQAARANHLEVLLSTDGRQFQTVYRHDRSTFGGYFDNRPLVVALDGAKARYVRIQLPERNACLHLDEVEVYPVSNHRNVALAMPATQSSDSRWSNRSRPACKLPARFDTARVAARGLNLAEELARRGVDTAAQTRTLRDARQRAAALGADAPESARRELYLRARWAARNLAFSNPLLDFDRLLLATRLPALFRVSAKSRTYTHMSDQYYGWFSRPGGGLCVLEGFRGPRPTLRQLTPELAPGNVAEPDVSYDGRKILFSYCRHFPGVFDLPDKLDKSQVPEEAFYHLYEVNADGSGLRRLTHGKHDDVDACYLPNGQIAFLSTRRAQSARCAATGARQGADIYVRCGGSPYRPVAVYTLHVMDADGGNIRELSPFEMFEWSPNVDADGRILYARWDYVDRDAMPYMGLWSTLPDGTGARALFGNYTANPHCMFEARRVPGSRKIVFTAAAHHANTAGSLVLLDPAKGPDGLSALERLTPEVPFPEIEEWPSTFYANPCPLSEDYYLVAWSDRPLASSGEGLDNALGIYLLDRWGNLELLYRDPALSAMYPLPLRARPRPPVLDSQVALNGPQEGRQLVVDVYRGLTGVPRGSVRRLRLVGIPGKTQPEPATPLIGLTGHDPGKVILGTVPVEPDGSAYFRVPSGIPFFVQALDSRGMAVQTMRSATYVQPGERSVCIGCHESRNSSPPAQAPMAARREPSPLTPGPSGSWPLDYQVLVQPVLDRECVSCHRPGAQAPIFDLTAEKSYQSLTRYGHPSLKTHVVTRHRQGRSTSGEGPATTSPLVHLLQKDHYNVRLTPTDWDRLLSWMDTYAQSQGFFSPEQADDLRALRRATASLLDR